MQRYARLALVVLRINNEMEIGTVNMTGYLFATVDFLPVGYFIKKLVLFRTIEMPYDLPATTEQVH